MVLRGYLSVVFLLDLLVQQAPLDLKEQLVILVRKVIKDIRVVKAIKVNKVIKAVLVNKAYKVMLVNKVIRVVKVIRVTKAIKEIKAGKVEFRVDKNGVIHAPFGKSSFPKDHLVENAQSLIDAVVRAKPAVAKGRYVRAVTVSSTMGPGIRVDVNQLAAK